MLIFITYTNLSNILIIKSNFLKKYLHIFIFLIGFKLFTFISNKINKIKLIVINVYK